VELVKPGDGYHWDGLKRGGDPARPTWLFQYTLSGRGIFQAGRQPQRVEAGQAFCSTIPSAHSYHGDASCPGWAFFWMIVNDSHLTGRLLSHPNLHNSLLTLSAGSPVIRSAAAVLLHLVRGDAMDIYQLEECLFRWMLECERWADQQLHPGAPKARLLEFVRRFTLEHLESPLDTSKLAQAWGLSRSNFSHYFLKTSGLTPAAYVGALRLEEAAGVLRNSDLSVKEVAAKTGFTDSNHLCKSFRRHFLMSPGCYRDMHRR
jgi:AraC-like DNA-binding protein